MEDRRRRSIAFEKTAKRVMKNLEDSDVKVGVTELQEQLDISETVGISIRQVAQQAMNENGQNIFEIFGQGEEEVLPVWLRERAAERFGGVGKKVSKYETGGASIE